MIDTDLQGVIKSSEVELEISLEVLFVVSDY